MELDDDAARQDSLKMARERQCAALQRFAQRRRGRDEGGVIVIEDSDNDDAPPPPACVGDAGQGSSRDGRVKEEKSDNGGDDGDYSAFIDFFY